MHAEDRRFRPRGRVTRESVTYEDVLELIELEEPATAAWTADGFGHDGTFHDGARIRVYGGPGHGAVRQRVTLRIAASEEVDPRAPAALRRSAGGSRYGAPACAARASSAWARSASRRSPSASRGARAGRSGCAEPAPASPAPRRASRGFRSA